MLRLSLSCILICITLISCKENTPSTNTVIQPIIIDTLISSDTLPPSNNPRSYILIAGWTEFVESDDMILDIRYATDDNFTKEVIYPCPRCFVRDTFAKILININQRMIQDYGYQLKFFDCYRPSPIQQVLWDKFPNPSYVTNPIKGSMHNRGMAVDITLVDSLGQELDMGTTYDHFGQEAHYTYKDLPKEVIANRTLLRNIMESYGCKGIRTEWWHYSLTRPSYAIADWEWPCE